MENIILSIDTKLVENKKSISNFNYKLPHVFKNVVEISLTSVEIPNSIYVFNNNNNNVYFLLTIRDINFRFYLKNGNYDLKELYDNLSEFFNTIESYDFFDNSYIKIDFRFDVDIARFKINSNTPFSIYFYNSDTNYTLGRMLGFSNDKYEDVSNLTGENIPDIIGDKYIMMKINDYGNVYHNNQQYFSKILINKESYEMIFGNQHRYITKSYKFKNPVNIDNLDIKFEDSFGRELDFNGIDLSFTLEFKIVVNDMMKQFYQKFNYDHELMKYILHDSMLKFFTDNGEDFNVKEIAKKYTEINNDTNLFNY